jgi:hypothetical protein
VSCCPTCGQTLPDDMPVQISLGVVQKQIVNLVRQSGKHGIPTNVLFNKIYGGRIDGGPLTGHNCLHAHINQINKRLARENKRICSTGKLGRGNVTSYVWKDSTCE